MRFSTTLLGSVSASAALLAAALALGGGGVGVLASGASFASNGDVDTALLARSYQDSNLVARSPRRGGGGFNKAFQNFRQIEDPNLNPGNAPGQGQNSGAEGIGQQSINGTSGLPNGIADVNDPQKNLFLDPSQIAKGLASDGNASGSEFRLLFRRLASCGKIFLLDETGSLTCMDASDLADFTPSLTSTNNFINFCLTRNDLPLTNGNQVKTGSCNAVPMGIIAAANVAPSSKFVNPKNLDVIPPNQDFTIQMAINHLQTGNFVNAQTNYYSGHSHVVIEQIDSLTSTTITDPTKFAFFKGLNDPAQNGILSAAVPGGLPAGVYKMSSINAAANHQPALVGVAQHGSLDDAVYFTVSANSNTNASAAGGASASASATASATSAAAKSAAASSSSSAAASATSSQSTGRQRLARSDSLGTVHRQQQRRHHQQGLGSESRLEKRLAALIQAEQQ
ncbi:hypothetical protein JCM10908_000638 [Rhodotorula pacifica]|uniref:uncharacterized protein n=1 Tax=Rhodotorula pacifica TaxID=1495444 RepID=UPI00317D8E2C